MGQFRNILVYRGASQSSAPGRIAARIAASSGAHVTLADAVEPVTAGIAGLMRSKQQDGLLKAAARMRRSGVKPSTMLLEGEAAGAVIESVMSDGYDLLVIPAPFADMAASDRETTMRLVKKSSAPVLLSQDLRRRKRLRILAAVDTGTWDSHDAANLNARLVKSALWFAQHLVGDVEILHAWEPVGEGPMRWAGVSADSVTDYQETGRDHVLEEMKDSVKPHRAHIGAGQLHVEIGDPRAVIPRFAADRGIDLIVMGTFARSGLSERILGNSAHAIIESSPCSMLIVPRADAKA